MKQGSSDRCQFCDEPGTIEHYFLECNEFMDSRDNLFNLIRDIYFDYQLEYRKTINLNLYDLKTYFFPASEFGDDIRLQILRASIRHGRKCLLRQIKPGIDCLDTVQSAVG